MRPDACHTPPWLLCQVPRVQPGVARFHLTERPTPWMPADVLAQFLPRFIRDQPTLSALLLLFLQYCSVICRRFNSSV